LLTRACERDCEIDTYIVVRGAANRATFAFDTLPPVLANRNDHVCSELQTSWMPYNKNVRTSRNTHLGWNEEWDTSRKVPGQLSCAEEQWTPSYCSFLFLFFSINHLLFDAFSSSNRIFFIHVRKKEHEKFGPQKYDSRCLSPFLSTKNVRNNDTSSCFRTEYFISWYL